jgi:hypothetical protein
VLILIAVDSCGYLIIGRNFGRFVVGRWSWGLGDTVGGREWRKVKRGTEDLRRLEEG